MNKKVRLKDIAAQLGISIGTVSLVLNGKADDIRISKALSEKIKSLAVKLGYVPNHMAVSLRTGQTKIICLIVEDFANPFFAEITSLVEARLRDKGYQLVCSSIANDPLNTTKLIKKLSNGLVDGFFITPMPGLKEDIQMIAKMNIPLVLLDSNYPDLNISHVLTNNSEGVRIGMQHLLASGHEKILFVSIDYELVQIKDRELSYQKAMEDRGLASEIIRIRYAAADGKCRQKLCDEILARKPDAIFFATNYLGIEGLECLMELGLKIPEDVAVICFDDHAAFRLYHPPITVIEQSINDIVDSSMAIMFEKLQRRKSLHSTHKLIQPKLIKRDSVKIKR